ncbi:MAG: hypothetical protein QGG40_01300, partial [Myxococcota bacterium]|jgi:malate synthase|nr:hypothetical protein [Myxococcota bacterium]
VPVGTRTLEGLRLNVRVGVHYLEAWLGGTGCVPLYDLMEDAATAEISRTQVWQWIRHGVDLQVGPGDTVRATSDLLVRIVAEQLQCIREEVGSDRYQAGRYLQAAQLFEDLCIAEQLDPFLTLPAYRRLVGIPPVLVRGSQVPSPALESDRLQPETNPTHP